MATGFRLLGRSEDYRLSSSALAGRVWRLAISAMIGVLLSVAGTDVTAQQTTYSYTPVSFPGAVFTVINGVNRAGDIVGLYRDAASTHMPDSSARWEVHVD